MRRETLFIGFVALALVALAGCSSTPAERREKFIDSAAKYSAKGDHDRAVLQLVNALRVDQTSADVYLLLAKEHLAQKDYSRHFAALRAAAKYNPDLLEARRMLAEAYLALGQPGEALQEAQAVLDKDPNDADARLLAASALRRSGDYSRAEPILDDLMAANANDPKVLREMASLRYEQKKLDEAEALLHRVAELGGNKLEALEPLASFYLRARRLASVEQLYAGAVGREPDSAEALAALGRTYLTEEKWQPAEEIFRKISLLSTKVTPQARSILGDYYASRGDLDAAAKEFQRLQAAFPGVLYFQKRLTVVFLAGNRLDDAERAVQGLVKANPKDPYVHLYRGVVYLARRRADEAIAELNAAVALERTLALGYYYLAQASLAKGNVYQAKGYLDETLKRAPQLTAARLLLAQLELRTGAPQLARAELEKVVRRVPMLLAPYLLHASALAASNEMDEAEKELRRLLNSLTPTSMAQKAAVLTTLAQVRAAKGDRDGQRALLLSALDADRRSFSFLVGDVAASYAAQGKVDEAARFLKTELEKDPRNAHCLAVLGGLAADRRDFAGAEALFKQALSINPVFPAVEKALVTVYEAQGRRRDADFQVLSLTCRYPDSSDVRGFAGYYYFKTNRPVDAARELETTLKLNSSDTDAANNLAWLYAETGGNLDVALKLAQSARERRPDRADLTDTLAWILVKKRSYGQAVALLEESLAQQPNNPTVLYHLGVAQLGRGATAQAKAALEKALKSGGFPEAEAAAKQLAAIR